ncbi:Protein required for ethanol metabolism [Orbilia oligospora]|uniref:Protein required for ethanol metabolism n=1 Tax=Orbilia oligospora TaxID=2813651 RepID=A0A8H2EAM2_ORBOL|nr:Protein required for ethanol metabolism [Orbilia oligospora]
MFRWYQAKLNQRPVLTQVITTAFLFGAGDITAQQAVDRRGVSDHDFSRTLRMTAWGGCFFGPVAVQWYKLLGRISFPGHPNRELLARVAADQIIFTPVNLLCFFTGMTVLEGGNPKEKLERSYLTTLRNNWMLWPTVQLVNFKFVPLEHRLLVVNVISLGWNSYLSYANTQK